VGIVVSISEVNVDGIFDGIIGILPVNIIGILWSTLLAFCGQCRKHFCGQC
jgi:hypothetical protein